MKYPGGKNHGSSYPRIINQIPPHHTYVELFAGSAAIRRMMRPSERSVLIDLDPGALGRLAEMVPPGTTLLCEDALAWLDRQAAWLGDPAAAAGVVLYCDPPYLPEACASRLRYEHVLTSEDHRRLLTRLMGFRCHVLISGYWSGLYANLLNGWRLIHWPQITRGGTTAEECLWLNYPEPIQLHDYQHLGLNFRERQDVRRQKKRWAAKLAAMTTLRRRALLSVLAALEPGPLGGNTAGAQLLGPHGRAAEPDRHGISAEPGPVQQRRKRRGSTPASAKTPLLDRPSAPTAKPPSWPATSADMPSAAAIGKSADGGQQGSPER